MSSIYRCPFCHAELSLNDVNVATDIALCRACGKTTSFSLISGAAAVSPEALNTPPRHVSINQDDPGRTIITYRCVSPILIFLVPFAAFWGGFSLFGIYGSQIRKGVFVLHQSLFGLPFVLGTLVMLGIIIFLLFGRWVITLQQGEGRVFVGVGAIGRTRRFVCNRNTQVSIRPTNIQNNGVPQKAICIQNGAAEFTFGALLKNEAKQFIAATIQRQANRG